MRLFLLLFLLLVCPPFSAAGTAETLDPALEEVLSGFDDEPGPVAAIPGEVRASPLSGSLSLGSSVNIAHSAPAAGAVDHRGLSRLKTRLDLQFDRELGFGWQARVGTSLFYDFAYRIQGRAQYQEPLLDRYEKEIELGEAYLQGELGQQVDIKAGRQIMVWGRADNLRVTDVWNPLDNREPGLVDVRDMRLPVAMTRVDVFRGDWSVSGLVVHEHRFDLDPLYGSDFFPASSPLPDEDIPETSLDNQELGLALNGIFSGWDISGYAATYFDDTTHWERTVSGLRQRHSRLKMFGLAGNRVQGNWLFKYEVAWQEGLAFFALPDREFQRLDLLAGVEYSGFDQTLVTVEAVNRHLIDFDPRLGTEPDAAWEDELQTVIRIARDFAHDTVHLVGLAAFVGSRGEGGAMERVSLALDLNDSLTITGGLILYQSGNRVTYRNIGECDRIYSQIRCSF